MPDELEERLRSHARSFDSLLSLIPAKLYYGEDVSDQWKRKKQTPEQKRAAKMAKLDPDNWKSAKDVLDERSAAAKRKRDESSDGDFEESGHTTVMERPKATQDQERKSKKRKKDSTPTNSTAATEVSQVRASTAEKKRQRKAEKRAAKQSQKQEQKEKKQRQQNGNVEAAKQDTDAAWSDVTEHENESKEAVKLRTHPITSQNQLAADDASTASSSTSPPEIMSPPAESATSSTSSIQPDQPLNRKILPKHKEPHANSTTVSLPAQLRSPQLSIELSHSDRDAARERLSAAISTFRNQRKADKNPRSRQDLLNSRRQKEDARRLAKKEQRRKEREEAARAADEEIERRFSPGGSGSLLGSPRSPPASIAKEETNSFSFGRIAFGDGSQISSATPTSLLDKQQRKGPQDAGTALQAAKNKASRISGLDENKRKEIEEKDMWLSAKRKAHGERVKDDMSLLKKALKRQEAQKKKSEKEWDDRKDGIQKAQEAKQRKRTENLAKRKDERKHGKKVRGIKPKKVKRPGFEGSFRGRSSAGKKK